ncbi:hypothetical protein C8T65DRAFT_751110 [Cerioporus squamosus]|nr:hypothetical protein C8T65DRAFT_751110 [Cerioporus squamosus]
MPIPPLSPCVTLLIMAELDILSLLRCRLVSRRFKGLADSEIRVDMRCIVTHYLPAPDYFLEALVTHSAVISGQAALALFLRDRRILGMDLEVSVKLGADEAFNAYVRSALPVVEVFTFYCRGRTRHDESDEGLPNRRTWTYKIKGRSKRYIRVVGCGYPSPLGPINYLRNSALLCFFSPILMGCAYPALTLRRLGLHRDLNQVFYSKVASTRYELARDLTLVIKAGFRLSWNPRDFIVPTPTAVCEHGEGCPDCTLLPPCVRHLYLCGCNVRYWGDRGCLMAVLEPSSAWRDLIIFPDPEGGVFTPWDWNWQRCGTGSGFTHDPLKEEMNNWNCVQGESRIHRLTIHIAPSFGAKWVSKGDWKASRSARLRGYPHESLRCELGL